MADINALIGGYKLRTLLQTGQTSQVFEVVEPHSNRHFAMKVLLPEAASDPEQRKTLFNEAEVGVKLAHQNVIRIFKVNRSPETPHFIMEFFPSGSLRLRLQAKDMKFIREHARKIFKESATGLAYMNAMGYVHRDVKPDNILVNSIGDTKIIDFAITRKVQAAGFFAKLFRKKGKPQGTPSFMSPEQIRDDAIDGRADIYSYACTLYELTTARKPFTGATQSDLLTRHFTEKPAPPSSYNKDLTDEFSNLVLKMMAKKREDRPKSFHEVLIELRKIKIYKDEKVTDDEDGAGYSPPASHSPNKGAGVAPDLEETDREEADQPIQKTEIPDTICLKCKHKWKLRRASGQPATCEKCGAKQEHLRRLKPKTNAASEAKTPEPSSFNPDDIDIDAL